ncbi:hypothetical protein GCM10010106_00610 [Thermopolyspora flexuosa]|jgi:hypothetical protein|uniref:CBU-0592-like domain-containing protein n=1 Tax=Thermopolyspora flexuosa TaxID=103836 RepID=A0A543IXT7_9ACTN|nr:hypothetical protein [Thermopolyspora flexuosa]TQM75367.1 hypothetical protein FHX40_2073 [Thermopolyspora flexuosa]GGM58756.1 hypothetical protein GCM10010106_00610 [Thermopolyspora flexuosa]
MIGLLVDVVGWVGAALLLAAYGLTSTGRIPGDGVVFQVLNLLGAVFLTVNTAYHHAWPSAMLNVAWIGIGIAALARRRARARRAARSAAG